MNPSNARSPDTESPEDEVRRTLLELLRLTARAVVARLKHEQKPDDGVRRQ